MKSILKEFVESLEYKGFLTGDIEEIHEFTQRWEHIMMRIFLENLQMNYEYEKRFREDIPMLHEYYKEIKEL